MININIKYVKSRVQHLTQILDFFNVKVVLTPVFLQVLNSFNNIFVVFILVTHFIHHRLKESLLSACFFSFFHFPSGIFKKL